MNLINEILLGWGYWGMFVAAVLAGSVLPLSSELVLGGLYAAGLDIYQLALFGVVGNTLGSLFNYFLGRLGKEEWIYRYGRVSKKKFEKGRRWAEHYGCYAAFLCWIPLIGSVATVGMGYLRTNLWLSIFNLALCNVIRYAIVVSALSQVPVVVGAAAGM